MSEVFHFAGGPFSSVENSRVRGRDPEGQSYRSFASFEDPDGNGWLLQEIKTRRPAANGRRPERDRLTSPPSQSCFAKRKSTTAATRRRAPTITGGTGMQPT